LSQSGHTAPLDRVPVGPGGVSTRRRLGRRLGFTPGWISQGKA